MSGTLSVGYVIGLLTVVLLIASLYLSARFRLEWRLVDRVAAHPNSAVFPIEIDADSAIHRAALARLQAAAVLRINPSEALVLEVDRGARRARQQRRWLGFSWCLTLLCAVVAILGAP